MINIARGFAYFLHWISMQKYRILYNITCWSCHNSCGMKGGGGCWRAIAEPVHVLLCTWAAIFWCGAARGRSEAFIIYFNARYIQCYAPLSVDSAAGLPHRVHNALNSTGVAYISIVCMLFSLGTAETHSQAHLIAWPAKGRRQLPTLRVETFRYTFLQMQHLQFRAFSSNDKYCKGVCIFPSLDLNAEI